MDESDLLNSILNAEFTFSTNCISGLVGKDKCNCWRCRSERKELVSDETNGQAAKEAEIARRKFQDETKQFLEKCHAEKEDESKKSAKQVRSKNKRKKKT